jgi:hypothetical protein
MEELNMTSSSKCISHETAVKLKEAGWESETEREYILIHDETGRKIHNQPFGIFVIGWKLIPVESLREINFLSNMPLFPNTWTVKEALKAPDAQEILKELDITNECAITWNDSGCFWTFYFGDNGTSSLIDSCITYKHSALNTPETIGSMFGTEFSEACASAWLWAKEQNLL